MSVPEVDVEEMAARHEAGQPVLDVRQPDEYEEAHVPGAVLIPLGELTSRLDEVPSGGPLLVICRSGARSAQAVEHLVANGVDATNVAGGTLAWIASGREVATGDQPGLRVHPYRWVDDVAGLAEVVDALRGVDALDTEFHRERTYYPRAALLQLAWRGPEGLEIALVDPLAVSLEPLAEVLDGPGLAVLHAAQQDLEVLQRSCGTIPAHLFDTQVAASFLGYSSASLVNLLAGELDVRVPKGDRLTDWLARPLSDDQKTYAASDVEHLLDLRDRIDAQLATAGRTEWVADECEELRVRPSGPVAPEQAWLRIKDHRHLRGPSRGVAQSVAAWRERRAAASDQPVRTVLPDLGILALAQRPPRTLAELRKVRGLDDRHARGGFGDELLAAIGEGLAMSPAAVADVRGDDVDRALRPAVTLVSAWVSQRARDVRIDTAVLATRQDLVSFLNRDADARLGCGWRAEVLGEDIRALVEGRAALAFSGRDLVLEPRSPG